MNLLAQYRTWLADEIASAKRDDSPSLGGLSLAMYGLRLLVESRPAALGGHCGVVSISPAYRTGTVCWQDEGHTGEHDQP